MTPPMAEGCLCGTVRYECSGEPVFSLLCHCGVTTTPKPIKIIRELIADPTDARVSGGSHSTTAVERRRGIY
jgi:hypothetical protein